MQDYDVYRSLPEDVVFYYRGAFSEALQDAVCAAMDAGGGDDAVRKRFFLVLVESLQNVSRHGTPVPHEPFLMIRKSGDGFSVTTGNAMPVSAGEELQDRLETINGMSPEERKEAYLSQLKDEGFSDKGGAGLGLLTLVRKSGAPLTYRLDPVSGDTLYFTLTVTL